MMGYAVVHTVIDDHSRVANAEIHDETASTATGVLSRAIQWPADRGVPSSECSRTTAAPTGLTCGGIPAKPSLSNRRGNYSGRQRISSSLTRLGGCKPTGILWRRRP